MKQELAAMLQRWKARLIERENRCWDPMTNHEVKIAWENVTKGLRGATDELETFLEEWTP